MSVLAWVAADEVKKYGGSRLLNFLRLDLHNYGRRAGTEAPVCKPQGVDEGRAG